MHLGYLFLAIFLPLLACICLVVVVCRILAPADRVRVPRVSLRKARKKPPPPPYGSAVELAVKTSDVNVSSASSSAGTSGS